MQWLAKEGYSRALPGAGLLLLTASLGACFVVVPIPATGGGCRGEAAGVYDAQDVVRVLAAEDLECDYEQVGVRAGAAGSYEAVGCGRRARYTCEDELISGCDLVDAADRDGCELVEE